MKIDILTLFPKMFDGPLTESILWRAKDKGFVEINIHDLRKWGLTERKTVDAKTYGGGAGMILRVDVLDKAITSLKDKGTKVVLLDAGGEKYTQKKASALSKIKHLVLVCGHYEGVDHRVHEHLVDEIISIGDYVLTGGEIPAMVIADSIVRLIPGVLKKEEATKIESHTKPGYLEYPQYTRPEVYKKWAVPKILLSGNHEEINKWRNSK